jgi:hypothetical protein
MHGEATMRPNTAPSPMANALGAMLRSGDPEFVALAVRRLVPALKATGGNLLQTAEQTGIPHRTLCRWLEVPAFKSAVERERAKGA